MKTKFPNLNILFKNEKYDEISKNLNLLTLKNSKTSKKKNLGLKNLFFFRNNKNKIFLIFSEKKKMIRNY